MTLAAKLEKIPRPAPRTRRALPRAGGLAGRVGRRREVLPVDERLFTRTPPGSRFRTYLYFGDLGDDGPGWVFAGRRHPRVA